MNNLQEFWTISPFIIFFFLESVKVFLGIQKDVLPTKGNDTMDVSTEELGGKNPITKLFLF